MSHENSPSEPENSQGLTELAEKLQPSVVVAPPVQTPPVQTSSIDVDAMTPLPSSMVRPLSWMVAVFGFALSGPAIWLIGVNVYRNVAGRVLPVWACCLLLVSLIVIGDSVLLRVIPNRLTLRCTLYTTATGIALTAAFMGALLISQSDGWLYAALQLDPSVSPTLRITGGGAVAWLFVMFNALILVTYVLGRVAYQQRRFA